MKDVAALMVKLNFSTPPGTWAALIFRQVARQINPPEVVMVKEEFVLTAIVENRALADGKMSASTTRERRFLAKCRA